MPLRAILATVGVVILVYLTARLAFRLRGVLLMIFLAGFVALLLNPLVLALQRHVRRRGTAVAIVVVLAALVFTGLALALGHPLISATTRLSQQLPSSASRADHGKGWLGALASKYHIEAWARENVPKLVAYGKELAGPALRLGKGTVSVVISVATFFALVILMLLNGQHLRNGLLALMAPARAHRYSQLARTINSTITGYMLGNLITSVIAGIAICTTLFLLGVPFALLWALWVVFVDLIPTFGGVLAGIPVILFAVSQSLAAGIVTLIVCAVYTQVETHILNPVIISRTVRVNSLLVLVSILVGASIGSLIDGTFGGLVGALFAIPIAGAIQIVAREVWASTSPDAQEIQATAASESDELRAALRVRAEVFDETCAALRQRALRAERELEQAHARLRRLALELPAQAETSSAATSTKAAPGQRLRRPPPNPR